MSPWVLSLTLQTDVRPHMSQARVRLPSSEASTQPCSPSSQMPSMLLATAIGPKASMSSGCVIPPTMVATSPAAILSLMRFGRICMLRLSFFCPNWDPGSSPGQAFGILGWNLGIKCWLVSVLAVFGCLGIPMAAPVHPHPHPLPSRERGI